MSKYLTIILAVLLFCSCGNKKTNSEYPIQNEFLKKKIENSKTKLKDKVYETGYSPAGKRLIEISQQVSNRTTELIERVSNDKLITSADIDELIQMSLYEHDTIKFDSTFLRKASKTIRSRELKILKLPY